MQSPSVDDTELNINDNLEEKLIHSCILAIQGIQSDYITWQEYSSLYLDPFSEKPLFFNVNNDDTIDIEELSENELILYNKEIEKRKKKQIEENHLLDQHCQIISCKISGFRIHYKYRFGDNAIPSSQLEIVEKISHMGTLFINIVKYKIPNLQSGIVIQSIINEINNIKNEYFLFLSSLSSKILSLRSLYVLLLPYIRKFSSINFLLDEIIRCNGHGGSLLSIVYNLSNHGNTLISSILNNIFSIAKEPFFEMIRNWLFYGKIDDVYNEFFITKQNNQVNKSWSSSYTLRKEMIPKFICENLAFRILCVGKSIDFLRDWNNDSELLSHESIIKPDFRLLDKIVDYGERVFNKRAVTVLIERYKFIKHFDCIKKIIFYEQGDFVQVLFREISSEMGKSSNNILIHRIRSQLESALCSSSIYKIYGNNILKNIKVQLQNNNSGTGWDSFFIYYEPQEPLNIIFTSNIINHYNIISSFLFQLRRLEYVLIYNRQIHPLKSLQLPELYQFHVIHNHMIQWVCDIQFYFMNTCINTAKKEFYQKLYQASNIDRVIKSHEKYLNDIMNSCFLSEKFSDFMKIILKISRTILDFTNFQNSLFNHVYSFQQIINTQLDPTLDTINIKDKRDYIKSYKIMNEYSSLISHFCNMVQHFKLNQLQFIKPIIIYGK